MLLRSVLYFEALLQLESIFARGAAEVRHNGPHAYYKCLLELDDLTPLNAIADASVVSDKWFTALLDGPGRRDDGDGGHGGGSSDGEGVGAIVPAAPVAAPLPPAAAPLPEHAWVFPCIDAEITVRLDYFSHASRRRRAYCSCPAHADCFKYHYLLTFDEPWKAVASIVLYMRLGMALPTKRDHQRIPAATDVELNAIRDEMPPDLLDPEFVVALPAD